ncbi:MAG: gliding motility-associated ABC transporter substrate-binding protein GldG [Saprospiraceae bacterium]
MWSIFIKEIQSFFSSLVGYVVIGVFLIIMGLVMWVFPDTSILNYNYATMETLFLMAPMIFTFLIPAITMRSLAEEKQTGTIELLATKPISDLEILLGKYFASVLLLVFALLPTLFYYYTVHQLGSPVGNLDSGAIMGSYLGLFLLGATFTSIGVFASSLSKNQISAFLLATFLCFFFYWGFFYVSKLPFFVGKTDDLVQKAGIEYHYLSISRGLIDSRDVLYFFSVIGIFLMLSLLSLKGRVLDGSQFSFKDLGWKEWLIALIPTVLMVALNPSIGIGARILFGLLLALPVIWALYLIKKSNNSHTIFQPVLAIAIFAFLMVVSNYIYTSFDMTEEQRFTLTKPTKELLKGLDDVVFVEVLLDGEFPAGFKRLQTAVKELLDDFRSESGYVEYEFSNPNVGSKDEINQARQALSDVGITPTALRVKDVDETKELIIYPWAVVNFKGRTYPVNLLEQEVPGLSPEIVLNNSVGLLEYKIANAIDKLKIEKKPDILFTSGHGELNPLQTRDLENTMRSFYNSGRIVLDSVYKIGEEADVVVIAKPRAPFSDNDKFKLDQYIMKGGKVLWLIDPLVVNLDSLQGRKRYIPFEYPLNLEDILFKYGVKIQSNLILDLECSKIPLNTGNNMEMFPWYYHPIPVPRSSHPIVKSLDRLNLQFPSTIDTFRTKTPVKKTVLLESSPYTRTQLTPVQLNFEILRYEPDKSKFNKGPQPMAVLLEGTFPSVFQNRVKENLLQGLEEIGDKFHEQSVDTRMIVVSDGDIARNLIANFETEEVMPLGFNKYERRIYSNKDFIMNSLEYLIDKDGIIEARSKEVKLRLLDKVKAKSESLKWQLVNVLLPVALLLVFGLLFNFWRRRKYAQS